MWLRLQFSLYSCVNSIFNVCKLLICRYSGNNFQVPEIGSNNSRFSFILFLYPRVVPSRFSKRLCTIHFILIITQSLMRKKTLLTYFNSILVTKKCFLLVIKIWDSVYIFLKELWCRYLGFQNCFDVGLLGFLKFGYFFVKLMAALTCFARPNGLKYIWAIFEIGLNWFFVST